MKWDTCVLQGIKGLKNMYLSPCKNGQYLQFRGVGGVRAVGLVEQVHHQRPRQVARHEHVQEKLVRRGPLLGVFGEANLVKHTIFIFNHQDSCQYYPVLCETTKNLQTILCSYINIIFYTYL